MKHVVSVVAAAAAVVALASTAYAGPIYLTGHDPDFHSQDAIGGRNQLNVALNYVTNGTYNDLAPAQRFLWVESFNAPDGNHRVGFNGLAAIGVSAANVTWVDAAGLAGVNFTDYSAIVVASTFGGMLTSAEINALIGRSADIASFVNGGGGLAAFAECFGGAACVNSNVTPGTNLFGFLPITVTSVDTVAPYHVTPLGVSLGLTDADVSECCTHNSFGAIGGLQIVDVDQNGVATTLAGNVRIGGGGFEPGIPEPGAWALMLLGFGGVGALLRSRRRQAHAFG
jgi:hypothetical protein